MLLIFSNQNSFSSTIRIFNMQKTSRINSDKSSIVDNQKERKLTTPNRPNNTGTSRDASDTPTQQLGHRHSTSTARAAPRPPRKASTNAQQYHIETQTNTRRDPPPYIQYSEILASTDIYSRETNFYHLQSIISQDTDLCLPHAKSAKMLYRTF